MAKPDDVAPSKAEDPVVPGAGEPDAQGAEPDKRNAELDAPSAERDAPSAERDAPIAERDAPRAGPGERGGERGAEPNELPAASPEPRRSGRSLAVLVSLTVVAICLVMAGVFFGVRVLQTDDEQARRETVLQTARQFALNLITIDYRTADSDVQWLLDQSTEQFPEQFFGVSVPQFIDVVKQSQLVSTGEVTSAGVERLDERSARVLVAANATVREINTPEGTSRNYRLDMELVRQDDQWLVSKVEFIL